MAVKNSLGSSPERAGPAAPQNLAVTRALERWVLSIPSLDGRSLPTQRRPGTRDPAARVGERLGGPRFVAAAWTALGRKPGPDSSPPSTSTGLKRTHLLQQPGGPLSHQRVHPPVSGSCNQWPEAETASTARKRKSSPTEVWRVSGRRRLCCPLAGSKVHCVENPQGRRPG